MLQVLTKFIKRDCGNRKIRNTYYAVFYRYIIYRSNSYYKIITYIHYYIIDFATKYFSHFEKKN